MTYYWDYGLTTAYGSKTPTRTVADDATGVNANEALTGLSSNTVYHCRLVATNAKGTAFGVDETFTTTTSGTATVDKPSISSEAITAYDVIALITATINPNKADTQYWVEYGEQLATVEYNTAADHEFVAGSFINLITERIGADFFYAEKDSSKGLTRPINGFLRNAWKVKCVEAIAVTGTDNLIGRTFILNKVGSDVYGLPDGVAFRLLNNQGVTVTPQAIGLWWFVLAGTVAGDSKILGAPPSFAVNLPMKLAYTDDAPVPSNMAGQLYALSAQGKKFVVASATPSGAPVVADSDTYPTDKNQSLTLHNEAAPPLSTTPLTLLANAGATAVSILLEGLKDRDGLFLPRSRGQPGREHSHQRPHFYDNQRARMGGERLRSGNVRGDRARLNVAKLWRDDSRGREIHTDPCQLFWYRP
jgi:hypothetical protein